VPGLLPPGDQAVPGDLPLLTNAVAAGHGLQVILWVPVAVSSDDDGVCRGQGDALAAGPGGQQEHKWGRISGLRELAAWDLGSPGLS